MSLFLQKKKLQKQGQTYALLFAALAAYEVIVKEQFFENTQYLCSYAQHLYGYLCSYAQHLYGYLCSYAQHLYSYVLHLYGYIVQLDFKLSDYLTMLAIFVALLTLAFTFIWRIRDRKRKLIEEIEGKWINVVEVSTQLRMDCKTLQQKFEFSDIQHLEMQKTIQDYDQLIFKKMNNNANATLTAFKVESRKMKASELSKAKDTVDSLKIQLSIDAANFKERMSLAFKQLERKWNTPNKSC